jgi:hypothetical protein
MASLLLDEGGALLDELWLVEDELPACDALDAGVAACVVAADVVVVMEGAACVVLAAAVGGVVEAPVDGGAAKAAALSAISAAPATTKRRTDIGEPPWVERGNAPASGFSFMHLPAL